MHWWQTTGQSLGSRLINDGESNELDALTLWPQHQGEELAAMYYHLFNYSLHAFCHPPHSFIHSHISSKVSICCGPAKRQGSVKCGLSLCSDTGEFVGLLVSKSCLRDYAFNQNVAKKKAARQSPEAHVFCKFPSKLCSLVVDNLAK